MMSRCRPLTGRQDAPRPNAPGLDMPQAAVRVWSVARPPLQRVRQPAAAPVWHQRAAPGRYGGRLRRAGFRLECAVELRGVSGRLSRPRPSLSQRQHHILFIRLSAPCQHRRRPRRSPVFTATHPVDMATAVARPRGCIAARSLSSNHHRGLLGQSLLSQHRLQRLIGGASLKRKHPRTSRRRHRRRLEGHHHMLNLACVPQLMLRHRRARGGLMRPSLARRQDQRHLPRGSTADARVPRQRSLLLFERHPPQQG